MAECNGGGVHRRPLGVMRQTTDGFTRAIKTGPLAESKAVQGMIQPIGTDAFSDFDRPDIA